MTLFISPKIAISSIQQEVHVTIATTTDRREMAPVYLKVVHPVLSM
jgi:hypothetical protein